MTESATKCCAERRAHMAQLENDRLNERLASMRRQLREQIDISDTARVQADELRRLLAQERAEKMPLVAALDESLSREAAMRDAFNKESAAVAMGDKSLLQLCAANDVLIGQLRDRDRQNAELRERIIEAAEALRAIRIKAAE